MSLLRFVRPRTDLDFGWQFRCPDCKEIHRHGRGLSLRASHCKKAIKPDYNLVYSPLCIFCGLPIKRFRDRLSESEYSISGLCQGCQDKTFGECGPSCGHKKLEMLI